ncbi:3-deoxy-manno-octulosonate cytidylyltransferase [Phreatobacter sp. AB_2022a]|uniref:3-deoxy-manno-octulosonate cytidylyltransferase n=1 Tax=Phreatobacter sp. AB_2022a TaxID=3003134 RepID=UPI002286DC93|nr:3-deoxy-manno-octulosonate cytidylyltransferase [Phreatobacter sp. AB_2022a]MCZ0737507.1 3-deoxy-manno-octulosonate cytidylyltransferase [Phreatobacter sp. AB_2022a]
MTTSIVLIPARMSASRLPGKPLADICGLPMIVHVMRRAAAAGLGRVVVATDSDEILKVVEAAGGEAVMTRADHPTGSDRIREAADLVDPDRRFERIINVQGDLPTLDPGIVSAAAQLLDDPAVDIGTLAAVIVRPEEVSNPAVVKAIGTPVGERRLRALYFSRATAPSGEGPLYHHIGLYAYRRAALERFVSLPPAPLEQRERLEQLRALENGMRIDVAVVDTVPLGVDTPAELERARALIAAS